LGKEEFPIIVNGLILSLSSSNKGEKHNSHATTPKENTSTFGVMGEESGAKKVKISEKID